MKYKDDDIKYLKGELFSNGRTFQYKFDKSQIIRLNHITNLCKGKKVIHLGFCDHLPLIAEKIKDKRWLHQLLLDNGEKVIGVDIDKNAVSAIKKDFQIQDIYAHDLTSEELLPAITEDHYDYLVIGEVLEHIDNPVWFLSTIKKNYGAYFDKIIISVPNALNLLNLRNILGNKEIINTDHRFWFTPYTLSKVATEAGFENLEVQMSQNYSYGGPRRRFLLRKYPMLRNGLILTASISKHQ